MADDELLQRATPGQLDALLALARLGTMKEARHQLGIGDSAMKDRMRALRSANGDATSVQLAYRIARLLDR